MRKDAAELWVRLLMVRNSKGRPQVYERFLSGVQLCSRTDPVPKTLVKIYAIPRTTLRHEAQQLIHNGMKYLLPPSRAIPMSLPEQIGKPYDGRDSIGK